MANFPPLKKYILYCLDRLIEQYNLTSPFLDVGCGIGDVSKFVAAKGWNGKDIDFSDTAIQRAKQNLESFTGIQVEKESLFQEAGAYKTIFLMDVLEHCEDDNSVLRKVSSLLSVGGYVLISVPSNSREWRWDDDFYGHYRRYTRQDITQKLLNAHFELIVAWDFTYPVFWLMRRLYTKVKAPPKNIDKDKLPRTIQSSAVNAWEMPVLPGLLSRASFFWNFIYKIQFAYFKEKVQRGHEMLVLAKRTG